MLLENVTASLPDYKLLPSSIMYRKQASTAGNIDSTKVSSLLLAKQAQA